MDMTQQPRLFVTAIEALHLNVQHNGHEGWSMHMSYRRQGDAWGDSLPVFHGGLSTEELLDVVCAEVALALGL